jgi:hypothetical protein
MVCPAAHRSDDAQRYLEQLCQGDAPIARAHELTQVFLTLVRERRGRDLEAWITAATDSGIDPLARFARGLQEDLAAVTAGLTLPWSNGPVEGQITRLKLLKRQGYGRAGFALLRQRVRQAAQGRGRRATVTRTQRAPASHGICWRTLWTSHHRMAGAAHVGPRPARSPSSERQSLTLVHQN